MNVIIAKTHKFLSVIITIQDPHTGFTPYGKADCSGSPTRCQIPFDPTKRNNKKKQRRK